MPHKLIHNGMLLWKTYIEKMPSLKHRRTLFAASMGSISLLLMLGIVHGGGLDGQGGHHDRRNGGYHFHRGPLSGQSFSTKSEAERALQAYHAARQQPDPQRTPAIGDRIERPPTNHEELVALSRLLIAKQIITEAELKRSIQAVRDEEINKRESP